MKRKGQFFMIGTVLLSGTILASIVLQGGVDVYTGSSTTSFEVFDQALDEFPRAVSIALQEERSSSHLEQRLPAFMDYLVRTAAGHGISSQGYLLVGLPTERGYNVTVGNYQGEELQDVWVTVGPESARIDAIPHKGFETVRFNTTKSQFSVAVNGTMKKESFTTSRRTVSLIHLRDTAGDTVWEDTTIN
jgi:hypothetical protein